MPDEKSPSTTDKIKQEAKKVGADVKSEINKIPPTSDRNLLAAFSYVWILSLVMLIAKRNDEFVKFHAKQGVVLLIISIFWFIPIIGQIAGLLAFAFMVFGFINAWQGKEYKLPLVYGWSQKIHF